MTETYEKFKPYLKARYTERMGKIRTHLGGMCVVCGVDEDLEVDHIDPSTKAFALGKGWGKPWDVLLIELDKCQLLCKQCHRLKSNQENSKRESPNKGVYKHGSHNARYILRCDCKECTDFHTQRMLKRRIKASPQP